MQGKGPLYILVAMNAFMLFMVFFVKSHNMGQAHDHIGKKVADWEYQKEQIREITANNAVLLQLASSILQSDKSLKTVTQLAKAARLPGRQGEKAFLAISPVNVKGLKGRSIGWESYSFTVAFDIKDQLALIELGDLLGKPEQAEPAMHDAGEETSEAGEAAPAATN